MTELESHVILEPDWVRPPVLRDAADALHKSWIVKDRFREHLSWITWTPEGAKLGAGTLLAKSVRYDRVRLRALLLVAFGRVYGRSTLARPEIAEEFAAWLSAIEGLSAEPRAEASAALEKAAAGAPTKGRSKRTEDALGTAGVERVERQGCPHCASREIVGWGRSDGLLRYRCKSCRRTFNALTKTPMAHLRKKDKWLDHARAMIEGRSLAKTAALCGVHPTTAFRWRHRF